MTEITAKLIIFDMDGTLISSYIMEPGKDYNRWRVLPGRVEMLAKLRQEGCQIAIVTNQGGVAFHKIRRGQAERKIAAVKEALGLLPETPVAVCYAHPRSSKPQYRDPLEVARRKPSGAMIKEIIAECPEAAAGGVLYVGDRPEDQHAARNAGVAFQWMDQFFS